MLRLAMNNTPQIPFMELVETQEIRRIKYKLSGGTPFAKMDIDEVSVARADRVGYAQCFGTLRT